MSGYFWLGSWKFTVSDRAAAGQRPGSLWPAEGARPKAVKGWEPAQQAARREEAGWGLGSGWEVTGTWPGLAEAVLLGDVIG